jgi:hypothetical protein
MPHSKLPFLRRNAAQQANALLQTACDVLPLQHHQQMDFTLREPAKYGISRDIPFNVAHINC